MWTSILATLTANLAPILGSAVTGLVVTWILGRFTDSKAGGDLLAKAMRQARRIGRSHSALGESKFGLIWNPLETFGTTWIRSLINEYFVGLREDNLEKLGEEAERLEKAGSVARVKAIRDKMEQVLASPQPIPDEAADSFRRAFESKTKSLKDDIAQ